MVTVPPVVGAAVTFAIAFGLALHAGRLLESYMRARESRTAKRFAQAVASSLICFVITGRLMWIS